jgi:hypothetical protein
MTKKGAVRRPPTGAVAAMITAVLALVLTGCGSTQGQPSPCGNPLPSPEPSGWAQDPEAISSYVASGLIPPYYVAVGDGGGYAFVRTTATGITLATIQAPTADAEIVAAGAAADDRTFVVETQTRGYGILRYGLYLFHLSSSGRPGALRRLPVSMPSTGAMVAIALSPDADRLAVLTTSASTDTADPYVQSEELDLEVYTLATGAVRTWTGNSPGSSLDLPDGEIVLSWTQDERTLSFPWTADAGARLLSLDTPGGNLLTASRPALIGTDQAWACSESEVPLLTPDGRTLACGAYPTSDSAADDEVAGIAEYDAADGTLERALGKHLSEPNGATVAWENSSGSVVIGGIRGPFQSCPTSLPPTVGVFTADRFVALPEVPSWFTGNSVW